MDNMKNKEQLESIIQTTEEIRRYFTRVERSASTEIQGIKQEIFEINIRLDEQVRTKNLYNLNNNSRKNVFSPIRTNDSAGDKEDELEENIRKLTEHREFLEQQLAEAETRLSETQDRMTKLQNAYDSANQLKRSIVLSEADEEERYELSTDILRHGEQVLNLFAFEKSYLAAILKKRTLEPMESQQYRLTTLQQMIEVDPERARLLAGEMITRGEKTVSSLKHQLKKLQPTFDEKLPLSRFLDDWITGHRDEHPEYVLSADVQIENEGLVLTYIRGLSLTLLLNIFAENISRHANANQVNLNILADDERLEVNIRDNGIGIPEDHLSTSPWYSGLHKAEGLIFLLGGDLQIKGTKGEGTAVHFSFPISGN